MYMDSLNTNRSISEKASRVTSRLVLPRRNSSTGCIKHFSGFLLLVDVTPYVTDIELRSKSS